MLGENRQKYLDQLNERLRNRQRRIENGEDPDEIEDEEPINERPDSSTGNILMDLDKRFEDERDALLRKLRVGVIVSIIMRISAKITSNSDLGFWNYTLPSKGESNLKI